MKLRLGELIFDTSARQLLRGTSEVHLSPKAFDLLKILVEQRPRALSKKELQEHLWPATFVSDVNLTTLVAEVREAFGDDARQPRFIRTAHRFGYAFCAEVLEILDDDGRDASISCCWLLRNGRRIPLHMGENVLGREPEGGVNLDSPTVSRRHARILISTMSVTLEDLRSKNGTFLHGARVSTAVPLKDGDEIHIGSVVLRFRGASPRGSTATWSEPERK